MIDVLSSQKNAEISKLVLAAFQRSVSKTQARTISLAFMAHSEARILVIINPDESYESLLYQWKQRGPGKIILLGRLPPTLASEMRLNPVTWPLMDSDWSKSQPAPTYGFSHSAGRIRYTDRVAAFGVNVWQRPLERFDFTDEWNNLGYGAIRMDGSPWSLAQPLLADSDTALAHIEIDGKNVATYVTLKDEASCSLLWFNRAVGPIDSFEWRLIENFLSSWRYPELPCQPIINDIPFGYDAAITMRLDCDEDVESARPLREVYRELGVPFSLAVHTTNLLNEANHILLKEMAQAGESILSHTATHAPNWGGSYENALAEGRQSVALLEAIIAKPVRYAVSPFHQTPTYALQGLADAGLAGCIGGIIRNDPEFLLARGGNLAGMPEGFIGHSQQHMLHGDCMLSGGDPLAIFRQAFDLACETRTLFGYLDHPFSLRYQYGWSDEGSRIQAHRDLIAYIRQRVPNPLFLSEDDAMDFLQNKSGWRVLSTADSFELHHASGNVEGYLRTSVEYVGRSFPAGVARVAL